MPRRGQVENLKDNRYGRLVVIDRAEDHVQPSGKRKIMWNCLCDCGNIKPIWAAHLKNGSIQSCGCLKKELTSKRLLNDLTGKRFERLVVLMRVDDYVSSDGRHRSKWLCRCDCGVEKEIVGGCLTSGKTKSCGCYNTDMKKERAEQQFVDLTGKFFGKLTVEKRADNNKYGQTMWSCKCECGRYSVVQSRNLLSGGTRSCGCVNMSHLEQDVFLWFKHNNYVENKDFRYQLKYSDLQGLGMSKLSYDFGVYKNDNLVCLIECQGRQHYKSIDHFGGESQLEVQQFHDDLKREYATNYLHVPLIEIPYTISTYDKIKEFFEEHVLPIWNT